MHEMITVQLHPEGFKEHKGGESFSVAMRVENGALVIGHDNDEFLTTIAIYAANTWISAVGSPEKDETP